ncbi:hypothetical protein SCLCIDRAFT_673591 [Scleroderma citrinum Foug A]|uniref:Uncharacterized protein n=1 Tax=Scleroderma citrinum Foug A TaxID=1036808 RepID=A0A0C3DTG5_9AGAM|nr:hypothetical protein SCLCIDRAFT_673591 [Scleroderma citrinum Foug A]
MQYQNPEYAPSFARSETPKKSNSHPLSLSRESPRGSHLRFSLRSTRHSDHVEMAVSRLEHGRKLET